MDLSLSLSMPVEHLARVMSEKEFARWVKYAKKKMLPWSRMEWYLAQISQMIAITMGGSKQAKIADFLCQSSSHEEDELTPEEQLEMAIEEFDVRPRKRRKKG
jgi:hypothetical protein